MSHMRRLRALVAAASEKAFDAAARRDGPLVFSRPGLRIYRRPDGSFHVVQSSTYVGPAVEEYIEALNENALEKAMVEAVERMTDEERSAMVRELDGMSLAFRAREQRR